MARGFPHKVYERPRSTALSKASVFSSECWLFIASLTFVCAGTSMTVGIGDGIGSCAAPLCFIRRVQTLVLRQTFIQLTI